MRFLHKLTVFVSTCIAVLDPSTVGAADYEVGDGSGMLNTISQVPWESLNPGDRVLIHRRELPYREKWVLCRRGTAEAPIIFKRHGQGEVVITTPTPDPTGSRRSTYFGRKSPISIRLSWPKAIRPTESSSNSSRRSNSRSKNLCLLTGVAGVGLRGTSREPPDRL